MNTATPRIFDAATQQNDGKTTIALGLFAALRKRLGRIGFDQVVGYLQDGLQSIESRPELTASTERVSAQVAAERMAAGPRDQSPLTLDVRAPREREQKRISGSVSMPLNHLDERLSELPTDRPLLVYCAGGYRSAIAASLLERHGFRRVSEIAGGIAAWEAAKLPMETGAGA